MLFNAFVLRSNTGEVSDLGEVSDEETVIIIKSCEDRPDKK